jgi:hypothetical protein
LTADFPVFAQDFLPEGRLPPFSCSARLQNPGENHDLSHNAKPEKSDGLNVIPASRSSEAILKKNNKDVKGKMTENGE